MVRKVLFILVLSLCFTSFSSFAKQNGFYYKVKPNDSLSKIALRQYNDAMEWNIIYDVNKDKINNPHVIYVGQKLFVPFNVDEIAGKKQQKKRKSDILQLVSGNNYAPFSGQSLVHDGMITEITKKAFKRAGYDFDIEFKPWEKGRRLTAQNRYDATFPYVKTPKREKKFIFSKSLYTMITRIFVRNDSDLEYEGLSSLAGLSTCKPKGYYISDISQLLKEDKLDFHRTSSMKECFKELKNGKVDFVAVNRFTGWQAIDSLNSCDRKDFKMLPRPIGKSGLHLMVSKEHPKARKILSDFNEAVNVMEEQGELDSLATKHAEIYILEEGVARKSMQEFLSESNYELNKNHNKEESLIDITFVTGNVYAPFSDKKLLNGGMVTEIVEKITKRMGYDAQFEYKNWSKAYEKAASNKYFGTFPYVKTSSREKDFKFSDTIYNLKTRIFVKEDSDINYKGMMSLNGLMACKPEGYYTKDLKPFLVNDLVELKKEKSLKQCFTKLKNDHVDFVPVNRFTGWQAIESAENLEKSDFKTNEIPFGKFGLHLMVSRDNEKADTFLKEFNKELKEMRDSGELKSIQIKHMESYQLNFGYARKSAESLIEE